MAREVAKLTLLGEEAAVRTRARELGLDLDAAQVISPEDPDLVERFAAEYAELRAHRGMTRERAREIVTDVSYFGTMMVHLGDRKSTRLNSSHVAISYAVFCLKKKKS